MLDIKWIRAHPDNFDAAMQKRGVSIRAEEILTLDKEKRSDEGQLQELQRQSNELAKQIGELMSQGKKAEAAPLMEQSKTIKAQIAQAKETHEEDGASGPLFDLLAGLPNILLDDVPEGVDETSNVELRNYGTPRTFDFTPKDHVEIGEGLTLLDMEQAASISGTRFSVLKGDLARMERALANFMLDLHTKEFGYTEVAPPLLTRDDALFGTGQLPKFEEDLFKTTTDHWLIPTSEVVLANLVRESILSEEALPLRFTAFTPCFRSEAGAAGKDTRGIIRMHQFYKVELVSITTQEQEAEEHERMTLAAEEVLKRLEIPYRVMLLSSGDTGFSARKTYDLEIWLPGQDTYREISSCSRCGDFQARRMKARYRKGQKDIHFVHTLNGTGLAVNRTIVGILENYQNADGSVTIPGALQPYMGGQKTLEN